MAFESFCYCCLFLRVREHHSRSTSLSDCVALDAQPLERLVIYEATFSQVQALCVVSAVSPPNFEDAVTRARLFWYAYTQEGVLTGVRGGRFVL